MVQSSLSNFNVHFDPHAPSRPTSLKVCLPRPQITHMEFKIYQRVFSLSGNRLGSLTLVQDTPTATSCVISELPAAPPVGFRSPYAKTCTSEMMVSSVHETFQQAGVGDMVVLVYRGPRWYHASFTSSPPTIHATPTFAPLCFFSLTL